MKITVKGYEEMKYTAEKKAWEVVYEDVKEIEVKTITAEEIFKETDGTCIDEYNEYVILHFEDGETATFRNSHVDCFKW